MSRFPSLALRTSRCHALSSEDIWKVFFKDSRIAGKRRFPSYALQSAESFYEIHRIHRLSIFQKLEIKIASFQRIILGRFTYISNQFP